MQLTLPIAAWAAWPTPDSRPADVGGIEPMLRRRLGPLARMAIDVAVRCLDRRTGVPMVFASRHGELGRTLGMLRALAEDEVLSPTAFSLSVHNAAAGVLSIARQDLAASTAIAAGTETFAQALIEAGTRLAVAPGVPVLLVYADEPIPAEYAGFVAMAEQAHAIALLLDPAASLRIRMNGEPCPAAEAGVMQSLAFLPVLTGSADRTEWRDGQTRWRWERLGG